MLIIMTEIMAIILNELYIFTIQLGFEDVQFAESIKRPSDLRTVFTNLISTIVWNKDCKVNLMFAITYFTIFEKSA